MEINIPGTVLQIQREEISQIEERLRAMFLAGGLSLGQVSGITGLEPHMVQNWVKRGYLPPPEKKRYSLRQLCRIMNINMLRAALPLEDICGLLGYVNGQLNDESDDLIDDSQLYFLFVRLAAGQQYMTQSQERRALIQASLADYREPAPGARERVEKVLDVMLTAWAAARLRLRAERLVKEIKQQN